MATYAVGDIQGCFDALECLLEQVKFDAKTDRLWVAGDLVNRGPASLETLRFIKSLGDQAKVVLGNHDLHLLAVASGARERHSKDTINPILQAPDCNELLDWLRHQDLIHYDQKLNTLMVHAGLPPIWSIPQAIQLAGEVTTALRGNASNRFFEHMYGNTPDQWHDDLEGFARLRVITNYLTRMRICTADGQLELKHKRGVEDIPKGYRPWFAFPAQATTDKDITIVFGHWAALAGKITEKNVIPLDTGCVWGGQLRMYRLDDRRFFHCDCASNASS